MKKPINNFAFALGLLAIAYALLVVPDIVEIVRQPQTLIAANGLHDANYVKSFASRDVLVALRSTVYGSGVLLGFAVLVELLDRIRLAVLSARSQ